MDCLVTKCVKPWTSVLCPVLDSSFDAFWRALGIRPFYEPRPHVTLLRRIPLAEAIQNWSQVTHDGPIIQVALSRVRLIRRHQYDVLLVDVDCQELEQLMSRLKSIFPSAVAEPLHITLGYFQKGQLNYRPQGFWAKMVTNFFWGRRLYLGEPRSYQIWSSNSIPYLHERIGMDIKTLERQCQVPQLLDPIFSSLEPERTATAVQ